MDFSRANLSFARNMKMISNIWKVNGFLGFYKGFVSTALRDSIGFGVWLVALDNMIYTVSNT